MSTDDFDKILAETHSEMKHMDEQIAGPTPVYVFPALLVAALPIYLFISPMFDMNLIEDGMTFAIVTMIAAAFLTMSYAKVANKSLTGFMKKRTPPSAGGKTQKDQLKASFARNCKVESMAYSLFINNLSFVLLFLTLAFWLVPKIPVDMTAGASYSASVVVPAALIYGETHGYTSIFGQ